MVTSETCAGEGIQPSKRAKKSCTVCTTSPVFAMRSSDLCTVSEALTRQEVLPIASEQCYGPGKRERRSLLAMPNGPLEDPSAEGSDEGSAGKRGVPEHDIPQVGNKHDGTQGTATTFWLTKEWLRKLPTCGFSPYQLPDPESCPPLPSFFFSPLLGRAFTRGKTRTTRLQKSNNQLRKTRLQID